MKSPLVRSLIAAGALALAAAGVIATTSTAAASPANPQGAASGTSPGHQWLTGYWHNFDNGSGVMPLSEIPAAYNLVVVAFADNTTTPGQVVFNLQSQELGGYSVAQFKADIAAIQAQGRKVIVSVGGEKGNVLINSAPAANAFATSVYGLMQEYGFDGVDIDLEHGISAQYTSDALHQLHALAGPSLIITMAPQTIDYQYNGEYWKLTQNIKDILTIVNMQFYNSGDMLGCDSVVYNQATIDFLTALTCIEIEQVGLSPSQVGIGVPAVPAGANGGGYVPPATVVNAITCLQAGIGCGSWHPTTPYGLIGGAMTWSVNWDKTSGYAWSNTVSKPLKLTDGSVPTSTVTTTPTSSTTTPTTPTTPTSTSTTTSTTGTDSCAPAWSAGTDYVPDDLVTYSGHLFRSLWWSKGIAPDSPIAYNIWSDQGTCTGGTSSSTSSSTTSTSTTSTSTTPTSTTKTTPTSTTTSTTGQGTCTAAPWANGTVYVGGDRVTYQGREYTAKWWTNSDTPGAAEWGPWTPGALCA